LVAPTHYSLSYSDPVQIAQVKLLNALIAGVTEDFGGKVADGFAAFEGPSAASEGSMRGGTAYQASRRDLQHPPLACRAPVAARTGPAGCRRNGWPPG
jgi:hypothetical protein